jgi:hypothetical protein
MISRLTACAMAGIFGAAVLVLPARDARADEVSPTGKGIAGGALLGAETVSIVEALIGVRSGWAYAIGAIVGAGGGGVGGYFVEQGSTDGKAPTYMLAGGLALIIPAVVLTLNATRYMPEEGVTEDHPPLGPAAEPGRAPAGVPSAPSLPPPPSGAPPAEPASPPPQPRSFSPSPVPRAGDRRLAFNARAAQRHSLVNVAINADGGSIRIGVPVIDVRPVFTALEQRQYGTKNDTELRMPVVAVSF